MQNIIMPLLIRGMGHREARAMCGDIVKLLGIDHRLDHRPNELSGGQKQRVSIARALASDPAILLADEPTGALDSASGQEVLKLFRQINDMGNTIVMITHDLKVAKAAKRIVKIVDGQLSDYTE
jgi:putative ABC transport system ATP-binding protein